MAGSSTISRRYKHRVEPLPLARAILFTECLLSNGDKTGGVGRIETRVEQRVSAF